MSRQIFLLGGGKQNEFRGLDSEIINKLKYKSIFVINLTKRDKEVLENKKKELKSYFKEIGFENIYFASDYDSSLEIKSHIKIADLLFIDGGDTEFLLENINNLKIGPLIKSFNGIIEGSSAGAYILCQNYLKIRGGKLEVIQSLGIVSFTVKAHYGLEFDKELLSFSKKEKEIYGISEGSYIIIEEGNLNFSGEIYLFKDGEKKKVN